MQTKYDFLLPSLMWTLRPSFLSLHMLWLLHSMMSQALLLWRHAVISSAGSIFTLSQSLVYPTLHLRPGKFPCPDSSWPEFVCNGLSTLSEEAAAFIWAQISASIWIICTIISSASQIQTQTCKKRPFSNRRCDEGQQQRVFSLL